jgi:sulfotransferase family protein
MALPTFLVVGAPRAATTSLHYYLAQHPDIAMSTTKEPNYFLFDHSGRRAEPYVAPDPRIVAKSVTDRAAYERLFRVTTQTAIGEASPLYLYTEQAPREATSLLPEVKVVAVVREPVERAYSHFVYVNDDLGAGAPAAFAAAVEAELPLPDEPYRPGSHWLRLGRYRRQLERWIDVVGRDRLLVLEYGDVVGTTDAALARTCRFLGVDESFGFDHATRYNPSTPAGPTRHGGIDRLVKPLRPYLKKALPPRVVGALAHRRATAHAGDGDTRPAGAAVAESVRARLAPYFADDVAWLREEFGLTFPG